MSKKEKVINALEKLESNKLVTPETIVYHGNENKIHNFSEISPSFFTTDKEYAKGYGDFVYPYKLKIKSPFDTATDESARKYYNNNFLNDKLGKEAKKLSKGERICANNADNFWAYLSVEVLINKDLNYDCIIVDEKTDLEYKTDYSIVPLDKSQIEVINKPKIKNKRINKNH